MAPQAIDANTIAEEYYAATDTNKYHVQVRRQILESLQAGTVEIPYGVAGETNNCASAPGGSLGQGIAVSGLGLAAKVDPEPISKTILGIFTGILGAILDPTPRRYSLRQATSAS